MQIQDSTGLDEVEKLLDSKIEPVDKNVQNLLSQMKIVKLV